MKTFATTVFVICAIGLRAEVSILVSPQWVKEHGADPKIRIIHVDFMKANYEVEHVPGAVFLWTNWLYEDSPELTMSVPEIKKATEVIRSLGISNDTHVVLYFVRGFVAVTARMFLTLEHLGLKGQVSLMDGGFEAWKKAGFEASKVTPTVRKGTFKPHINNLLIDKDYVLKNLKSDQTVIVDARPKNVYDGEPTSYPRNGHIAGAKNIPFMEMVDQNNVFKPVDELQKYFTPVFDSKGKEIITYCYIGQTASVVYMAARILGYTVKQYDGSMQEWNYDSSLPMEITEKKD